MTRFIYMLIISIVLWFQHLPVFAQPVFECNFETFCPYLCPLTEDNIWSIAAPEKNNITSAHSPNFCVVTDAFAPIESNVHDYVQFDLPGKDENSNTYNGMNIDFYFMYDLGLSGDVASIELAFDSSEFNNLTYWEENNDPTYFDEVDFVIPEWHYWEIDSGFSGSVLDWRRGNIFIVFYAASGPVGIQPDVDTVHLRFNLYSDNNNTLNDGFAIDDLSAQLLWWSDITNLTTIPDFNIYPNPCHNSAYVSCPTLANTSHVITIRSIQGKVMATASNTYFDSAGIVQIAVEQLPPGTYICEIRTQTGNYSEIFVKQ
ncbi:MAG TPA: T9SS type A sorting domain-containing protein [Chitinophagales bacterium]|nr:T9SS type A sorting domain-containing protein [Chitinophagales bacterium]